MGSGGGGGSRDNSTYWLRVVEMLVTAEKPQARTLQLEQLTVAAVEAAAVDTMLVTTLMLTVLTADQVFLLFDI